LLPPTFPVLDKSTLSLSDDDLAFDGHVVLDAARNVLAFLAFGYCAAAYLAVAAARPRALRYLVPILAGVSLSLAIELTQAYLPGRDSSLLDLICNTVGTVGGVLLHRWAAFHGARSAIRNRPGTRPRS